MTNPEVEAQSIPLPAMVAAIWGGFIFEGLLTHGHDTQYTGRILDTWGQGCVELVIAACLHLPQLWSQISRKWEESDSDLPGVFEYEVVSSLGSYFGDYLLTHNGEMPTPEQVQEESQRLIEAFFHPLGVKQLGKAS